MKRRKFIRATGIAAASAIASPYILPSGRLFASSGLPKADHVVYLLFAGGVRQQESILQRYLDDSQDVSIPGNILYNMLEGQPPPNKIVYGTTPTGQPEGSQPIPKLLPQTLQQQGTLFPEVRYSKGGTGHYSGLNTAITGTYDAAQGLKRRPVFPTIFEYARRHLGLKATDTWFIGDGIGNSVPLLNHSEHKDYGAQYGANFLAPNITFSGKGEDHLAEAKVYHPEEQLEPIEEMKKFLDSSFQVKAGTIPGIHNTFEEKQQIQEFVDTMFKRKDSGQIASPPVNENRDVNSIAYACEVLAWFKPKLTVVNMNTIDSCHNSFTNYLRSMHHCDHGVGFMWDYIQNKIPEMSGKTAFVIIPEHGRNISPNPILDENDWHAYDHDSDANSRRIFGMMAGPNIQSNLQVGGPANPKGDASDGLITVADLLGVKNEVAAQGLIDGSAMSWFDRI